MSSLILKTLVLSKLILEVNSEIVKFAFLIENHFEIKLINFAIWVEKVNNFLNIRLLCVDNNGCKIFDVLRLTFCIVHLHRSKFCLFIELSDLP